MCWVAGGCGYSPEQYLAKGNRLFADGRYEEASINYRNAINKRPQDAEAYRKLGLSEFAQGRVEKAAAALVHARQLAPQNLLVLENLADVTFNRYLAGGRTQSLYDSAASLVKELVVRSPASPVALRLEASLAFGDGKLKEAIAFYREANALTPFDPAVVLPLAEALRMDGEQDEAESLVSQLIVHHRNFAPAYTWLSGVYRAANRTADAENILKDRIRNNPSDFGGILELAAFYRNQHREKEERDLISASLRSVTGVRDRYALAGDFYAAGKDWRSAENSYRDGIAAEPLTGAGYLTRIASLYVLQNRSSEAETLLDQAVREEPENWRAQAMRISLMLNSGKPEKLESGMALAKSMIRKRPADGRFPALLARACELKGDEQAATNAYKDAARLDRQLLEPRLALARMSQQKRDYAGVFRYSEEVLRVAPQNPEARLLHAWAWTGQGDYSEADKETEALLRDFPASLDVQFQAGLLYLAEHKTRAAIDVLSKLLAARPGDERILAGLATAWVENRSWDTAIQVVSREVEKDPGSESKRLLLASLAEKLGRFDIALQQLAIVANAHPASGEYPFQMGMIYESEGDKANAIRSFEAALRLAPNDSTRQGRLALAYYAGGMLDRADAAYSRSIALNPGDPVLLNNRAFFLAETGRDTAEALRLAQSALQKMPDNPALLDTLAFSYIHKNMADSASTILNRLVSEHPAEATFRFHLAMALAQQGQRAAAVKELRLSLARHPSREDQLKIKEMLSRLG